MLKGGKKLVLNERFWEILPGGLAWLVILFPLWGSFFMPKAVAYFVIGFLIFWFYQSFKSAFLGVRGYYQIKKSESLDWRKKYYKEKKKGWLDWHKIRHVVIIPNYNESAEKISTTLDALNRQKGIDKDQLIVVLAMEERDKACRKKAEVLLRKYRDSFGEIIATFHPSNIPGEIKGKASNESWAAKQVKKQLVDKEGYDLRYLTVTSCDCDAQFHPKYFSALTYQFASSPERYLKFWQSPILWYNNLNKVPAPIRVVGIIGNVIHIAHLQDPDGMFFNYSTYSLSFKLLDDVGYWDTDVIPEDWHIFLQSFFAKKGKVSVSPIFLPTSIDAPEGETYWEALKNRYFQCQRHAWGATDIPYAIKQAFRHPEIPWAIKFVRIFKIIETHLVWSTNWFILTFGALLPTIVNPKFVQTSLGYNLPKFSQIVLTICLLALAIIILVDLRLRPARLKHQNKKQTLVELFQWFLMPIATLFMSVLPGLDAQTKLMIGKRIEYKVTKKL